MDHLPEASVMRIIKSKMPSHIKLQKEVKMALTHAAGIYVLYHTAMANDFCLKGKRTTIKSEDLLNALDEMEMGDFQDDLKSYLKAHQAGANKKKADKAAAAEDSKKKKEKSEGDGSDKENEENGAPKTKKQKVDDADSPAAESEEDDDSKEEEEEEEEEEEGKGSDDEEEKDNDEEMEDAAEE
eukprot:GFYU01009745.1.p1 GENE.GFYU01009745.1~~GFYU01009745.1.p1  ORF type:complete len:184 (+),score=81.73 GFYU01009745.1:101-652(+)